MPRALSAQRAISLSILGLAIAGLCVDRMLLGGGADAAAAAAADDLLVTAETAPPEVSAAAESGTREPPPTVSREAARMAELAHALRGIGIAPEVLHGLPEAFDVARPVVVERTTESAPPPPPPMADPPMVSAVLSGSLPQAIAGGRAVSIGDRIDGWLVVDLTPGRVLFEQHGRRVERVVPQPDLAAFAPRSLASRPIAETRRKAQASAGGCSGEN